MTTLHDQNHQSILKDVDYLFEIIESPLERLDQDSCAKKLKENFNSVRKYLKQFEATALQDKKQLRGIHSIVQLATNAAKKLDLFPLSTRDSLLHSKEYRELYLFYDRKVRQHLEDALKAEAVWKGELQQSIDITDLKKRGLRSLEIVNRDELYELFFIRKADGSRYYTMDLLRHMRLVTDFESSLLAEDDPLVKLGRLKLHFTALKAHFLYSTMHAIFQDWLTSAKMQWKDPLVELFYKSYMALCLAHNSHGQKSSTHYFSDFISYLRELLSQTGFERMKQESKQTSYQMRFLRLLSTLCEALFATPIPLKESMEWFYSQLQRSCRSRIYSLKGTFDLSSIRELLEIYEELKSLLSNYPGGPLFKMLELFENAEQDPSFDPYLLGVNSFRAYQWKGVLCHVLFSPTMQRTLDQAKVIPEWIERLDAGNRKEEKIVLLNLQERLSIEEIARCSALEELSQRAVIKESFFLIGYPTLNDFYFQAGEYLDISDKPLFKSILMAQFLEKKQGPYFFSKPLAEQTLLKINQWIDDVFFKEKDSLTVTDRLNWIELFHHLLLRDFLQKEKATHFYCVSKDGVDQATTYIATFYCIEQIFSPGKEVQKELIHFLFFLPALIERDRVVQGKVFHRSTTLLAMLLIAREKGELTQEKLLLLEE